MRVVEQNWVIEEVQIDSNGDGEIIGDKDKGELVKVDEVDGSVLGAPR